MTASRCIENDLRISSSPSSYPVKISLCSRSIVSTSTSRILEYLSLLFKIIFVTFSDSSKTKPTRKPGLISILSASSPAIRTYPPSGNNRIVYCVSFFLYVNTFGPKPIANSRHKIPARFAKTKWPNSWKNTSAPKIMINAKRVSIVCKVHHPFFKNEVIHCRVN